MSKKGKEPEKAPERVYYSFDRIKKENALYNLVIGERSNGKSYAGKSEILDNYFKSGEQGAIIRREDTDFKSGRAANMWNDIEQTYGIEQYGWDGIEKKVDSWVLYKWDTQEQKKIYDTKPFCYAFALSQMEHTKSLSFPNITTIIFDECVTRKYYLPNEFVLFMNVLSTIIRDRDNVKIYMLGNTVNKDCPYFKEMGLKNILKMNPGDLHVYTYGNSDLKVAVEYANTSVESGGKASDKYFAFDNPSLSMITGGSWELSIYPHRPSHPYRPKDIKFTYFIQWEDMIFQCEIICNEYGRYTFIHEKTTDLKNPDVDLIYSPIPDPRRNWKRRINAPTSKREEKIWQFFLEDKVYYQDNEIGDYVRSYLQFCRQFSIIKE